RFQKVEGVKAGHGKHHMAHCSSSRCSSRVQIRPKGLRLTFAAFVLLVHAAHRWAWSSDPGFVGVFSTCSRGRQSCLTAHAWREEDADGNISSMDWDEELRKATGLLQRKLEEEDPFATVAPRVSPLGHDWTVERVELQDGMPPVGTVLLADPRSFLESTDEPPAAARTGLLPSTETSRREKARLPVVLVTRHRFDSIEGVLLGSWSGKLLGDMGSFKLTEEGLSARPKTELCFFGMVWSAGRVQRRAQQNPYDVLGLGRTAGYDDIRAAFRRLARKYHPDVPDTGDDDRFRDIREALEELGTPEGRTRWARPSQAQSSYSSYPRTDPFEKSWKQETRRRWQEQERAREQERRWQKQRQQQEKEEAKKARAAAAQDTFFSKELKKAVAHAQQRQAARRMEWKARMKEAAHKLREKLKKEMSAGWNIINDFEQQRGEEMRKQVDTWSVNLESEKEAAVARRAEDGKRWVEKFAEVQRKASHRQEEIGKLYADRLRAFREEFQQSRQASSPERMEKIKKDIEDILDIQEERTSSRMTESYSSMMASLQRSMTGEPKIWKDTFRQALMRFAKGGNFVVNKKWQQQFQETMRKMGEKEMDEVSQWIKDFNSVQKKESKSRTKLAQAGQRLKKNVVDRRAYEKILRKIDGCHKAEMKRLQWQAWDRRQWLKKFRQEEDRLYESEKEQELKQIQQFWKGPGTALRFKFFWNNVVWRRDEVQELSSEAGIWIPVKVSRDLLLREPDSSFEDPLWVQYADRAGGELRELSERFGLSA
ncbi:unnamed protein product, partial [Effrenium voratum]